MDVLPIAPVHAQVKPVLDGSLLGNHGDGINLHKKIGVCQCWDKDTGNDGWIRTLAPHFLERLESSLSRLAMEDIDVPLYDMLEFGPACPHRYFQIRSYPFSWESKNG